MYTNKSFITKKEIPTMDLPNCPSDTISDIAFNLENTHMAVSSWDGTITVYQINHYAMGSSAFVFERVINMGKVVLTLCFFNNNLFAGLEDGTIMSIDSTIVIKPHGAFIKSIRNFDNRFIISASFDSTLKFWNMTDTLNNFHSINLVSKPYSMDLKGSFLCVAFSDKNIITYNLNDINQQSTVTAKFSYAIRSIGCHKDMDSFAVGGVEAKVETFSRTEPMKKCLFRTHRTDNKLYSVNVVRFSPLNSNLMVTGGADGAIHCFDKISRSKLHLFELGSPVTAGEFSQDGKFFVFALGDDWSKGYTGVFIKPVLKMVPVNSIPGMIK